VEDCDAQKSVKQWKRAVQILIPFIDQVVLLTLSYAAA
jgi:hypothetical protein